MPTGRVGVEVAADEPQLAHTALQLRGTVRGRNTGRLRQLTDSDEILRIQTADAVYQIVAHLRPAQAGGLIANVMCHRGSTRREDREIRTAFALQFELGLLEAVPDLVVADAERSPHGPQSWILEP